MFVVEGCGSLDVDSESTEKVIPPIVGLPLQPKSNGVDDLSGSWKYLNCKIDSYANLGNKEISN